MSPRYLTKQCGKFLTKPPIKVLVGEQKVAYYIQPNILSSCESSSADVRMSGSWKSTGDNDINWTDFEEQTIECVSEYLYTGDYDVPKPADGMRISDRESGEIYPERPTDGNALERPLTPTSNCLEVGLPEEHLRTAAGIFAEKVLNDHNYTVGISVLVHAKVYSFAHCDFFSGLAKFALQRLTQILVVVPCKRSSLFPYLADAIRLIYDTTPRREAQEDPARRLLSQYVAFDYTNLTGEELDALADEGCEFKVDLSSKLARRLTANSHKARLLRDQIDGLTTQVGTLQMKCKDNQDKIRRVDQEFQDSRDRACDLVTKRKGKKRTSYVTAEIDR
ncbi:hypothetical protein P154DRAFT_578587 [Amniculicola lignicola CBS 123094]|uniref:BTB domain-containing protein n=1 Tax=Amniculicola lignicola CBS 123094 TaxID=1392246 RepID=A0A6A5WA52_9PLEO|nr:hypothetical protein P154DRAFT_578587 [Amniculicola lignicola CBS 123094]